ncbi:MAG: TonB-dependent receptor plug domain-containing protein [Spirosomataceae bacterium]
MNPNKSTRFLLFVASVLVLSAWVTPPESIEAFLTRFHTFMVSNPTEKVYLHTDKPYYAAGDTIWIKGYVVDGILHRADSVSRAVYIKLADEKGRLVANKIMRAQFGLGQQLIVLPDSMPQGNYQLVAFTNWMRNQPSDYFFQKVIPIFQPAQKERLSPNSGGLDLQFFPEGGSLVNELVSKVGFKAVNQQGNGVDIEGVIEEIGTGVVTEFKSEHLGIGAFNHYPKPGKQYVAKVKYMGKELVYALPSAKEEGVVISIGNLLADNIKVSFAAHLSPEKLAAETFNLVAHVRGQVRYIAEIPKDVNRTFYVPRNKIPDEGIVHFTLFDKNLNPVAERLVFNKVANQRLNIKIEPNKVEYSPREQVSVQLTATNSKGLPVQGSFSLAAVSESQIPDENLFTEHIVSYLLMSSDLRGTIEQPAYYFDSDNPAAPRHLDLLMMTQGWRRFVWSDVAQNKVPAINYAIEQGLTVSGRINNLRKKKDENPKATLLLNANNLPYVLDAPTNDEGEFSVSNVDFSGLATVSLKNLSKGSVSPANSILLQAIRPPEHEFKQIPLSLHTIEQTKIQNYLTKIVTQRQLKSALASTRPVVEESTTNKEKKKEEPADPRRNIYGTPDFTLKLTEAITDGAPNLMQIIAGRLPGVTVSGGQILIRGVSSFVGGTDPLFLVDGVQIDMGALSSIPPKQVEAIDVLKGSSASALGTRGANGVIAILTKRTTITQDPSLASNQVKGFEVVREFYSPRYDTNKRAILPDNRSTLYWAPMVQTDANGKATVSFWNSDERTTVRVVVEGMSPQGWLGTGQQTYVVSNFK